jgi:hypothetical protein
MENKQKNPHSRVSFTPDETNSSPLRRSRADTMPSQSSAFPYAPDIFTTLPPPPSLPALSNSASRNRSGSVTLPTDYQESHYSQTPFGYSPYDPSSPIDENASSTIASTLASLGLDDENNTLTSSSHFGDRHHPHLEDSVLPQSTSNRARSYTVGGSLMSNEANPNISSRPEISRLIGPFSPFSPQTRSSVMQRPRAISLGMADNPISNAFTPFDMTSTTNNTSSTSNNNNNNSSSSVLLRMHDSPILRSSRSSGNLAELNSDMYTRSFTNLDVHEEMSDQVNNSNREKIVHVYLLL